MTWRQRWRRCATSSVATVLSIQNGVLKNAQLADAFGAEKTVGAATFLSGEVLPDGTVRCTANQILYVGELPAGTSARVQQLVEILRTVRACRRRPQRTSRPSSGRSSWRGLAAWPSLSSHAWRPISSSQTRIRPWSARGSCARPRGSPRSGASRWSTCPPSPCTPSPAAPRQKAWRHYGRGGRIVQARAPMRRMSSLQDLERGRRLEVEETLGYVVAHAATAGLAVPTVDTCYRLISGINRCMQRVRG